MRPLSDASGGMEDFTSAYLGPVAHAASNDTLARIATVFNCFNMLCLFVGWEHRSVGIGRRRRLRPVGNSQRLVVRQVQIGFVNVGCRTIAGVFMWNFPVFSPSDGRYAACLCVTATLAGL